ncbi:hypothetical protein FZEAL_3762 [Fusarium zealandicum]|uniref:C2H2-type domain-containing protein n=1 Tax=Fusarium zealandicum TaxID=1053134 RepID=A0A8H4UN14_9HYPO|nr:hypothetical protein FZEAL_3762 [Fusarium zealandicum]
MSRRSIRSHRHGRSSRSSQPQQDDIPIDPNLMPDPSFGGYYDAQDAGYYRQVDPNPFAAGPSSGWQDPNQACYYPTTVAPSDLILDPVYISETQEYDLSAYQNTGYDEPTASSSAAQEASQYQCPECNRACRDKREYTKHMKTHNKPVSCQADMTCTVKKAEERDMDRHYRAAHKEYAATKGIMTEDQMCGFQGCPSKFTRYDNLQKHWKKYHNYEPAQ